MNTTQQPMLEPAPVRVLRIAPPAVRPKEPTVPRVPDRRWSFLLACLAVYVLTAVGRVHQLFAWLEPLHLTLLSAAAATGYLFLSNRGVRGVRPVLRSFTTRAVLGIGVWIVLSIPGALWPGGALHLLTDQFAKAAVMLVVIASAVRGLRDVERLTFAYLAGVTVYAVMILLRFRVGGGGSWRLGSLYYYDANEFATLAVMALPLGVYFLLRSGSLVRRAAAAAALGILTVAFIWAGSRGGFLALLAVGAFLLVRYTAVPLAVRLAISGVLVLVFAATASETFWTEMRTILKPQDDYNFSGDQGRVEVWKRGIGYMLDHPFFGVGADNFPTAEGMLSPLARGASLGRGVKWSAAHNSFLEIGAELGFPGLLLFLGALGGGFAALRAVRRKQRRSPGPRSPPQTQLAQALAASLVGFLVGGFFLSLAYRDLLYVLLALIVALHKVTVAPPPPAASRAPCMVLFSILIGLCALALALPTCSDLLSLASLRRRRASPAAVAPDPTPRLLLLIPAHNEELLLETCLDSLHALKYPRDCLRVVVIADNCSDQTAQLARRAGVECLERHDLALPGKPRAIAWALEHVPFCGYDAVVILDADTIVDRGFAAALATAGPLRRKAVQGYNGVSNPDDNAITRMAAVFADAKCGFAYALKQRAGLNLPLRLGGCIGTALLAAQGWEAFSIGEDWELYALLTTRGVHIEGVPSARVYAEESRVLRQSAPHRKRWAAGRLTVFARNVVPLLRSRRIGFRQKLDALAELSAPGPVVHLGLAAALAGLTLALQPPATPVLVLLLLVGVARHALYTAAALTRQPQPGRAALAFAFLPLYGLWRCGVEIAALRMLGNVTVAPGRQLYRAVSGEASR